MFTRQVFDSVGLYIELINLTIDFCFTARKKKVHEIFIKSSTTFGQARKFFKI